MELKGQQHPPSVIIIVTVSVWGLMGTAVRDPALCVNRHCAAAVCANMTQIYPQI